MKLSEKMILMALETGAMTVPQLMARCEVADITVRQGLSKLHADKAAHIARWIPGKNNQWCVEWALGAGVDALKPAPILRAPPPPRRRHPTVDQIEALIPDCGPFACLIGQMGAGR